MLSSMRTVAVANRKGGTSKTTTVVSFAAILGELGHRVLVVDVDPQGSATDWLATRPADVELADVFRGEASIVDAIQPSTAACGSSWKASTSGTRSPSRWSTPRIAASRLVE